ncbi:MAG: hypothetical protein K8R18_06645 [Parvibaculum sp.]|uniref:hypothetical protein n=1 Tax=Parvibaculum sp. TaxID=2024848 RepID=UPI0025DC2057|nr:hypothetical protein [Parvibaculum sp.]MCE9649288.1 hypothetical protein [Parvibaculum sp.]
MSVAAVLQSLSVESAILLLGGAALLLIIIGLQIRNVRWVARLANSEASVEAKTRIEKLIRAVEAMSSGSPKKTGASNRPVGKGRKHIPAIRSGKTPVAAIRTRRAR